MGQIGLDAAMLHVRRVKSGKPKHAHPIRGDEMRALRKIRREVGARAAPTR